MDTSPGGPSGVSPLANPGSSSSNGSKSNPPGVSGCYALNNMIPPSNIGLEGSSGLTISFCTQNESSCPISSGPPKNYR